MLKSKKNIILITIAIIVILVIVAGIIIFTTKNKKEENKESTMTSELCQKITKANEIAYTKTIDENNKITIIVKGNEAYKEITLEGKTKRYIVKNGDTYYLDDSEKKYYKYQSNDEILTEIREQFEKINTTNLKTGKEDINGKKYKYEEISQCQDFLFNDKISVNNLEYAKTRLYYKNGELYYIKTIVGENEELMKINISYGNINDSYFDIPSDYTEV